MDINISNGLNKNIIIGIVALLVIAGSAFVVIQTQYPVPRPAVKIDGAAIEKNLSEVNILSSDILSFGNDDAVSSELNNAINEVGEVSMATTLNDDETNVNNLSSDLTDIAGDEAASNEIDKALGDAVAN